MTVLEEMTRVMLTKPGTAASTAEIAAWYECKANLLDRIAEEEGANTSEAHALAATARAHARQLQALLT